MFRNSKSAIGATLTVFLTILSTSANEPWYPEPDQRFFAHERPPRDTEPPQLGPRRTSPPLPPEALRRNGYQSVQVNVDEFGDNILGDAANEPSIAIDPTDPSKIVIGWRQFDTIESDFREAGWAYSHDAGQTWTFPGVLEDGVFRSDPVLAADAEGNFYFYSLRVVDDPLEYPCYLFKSIDRGLSWFDPVYAFGGDKPWMVIDRTGGNGHGNIYAWWQWHTACCGSRLFTRSVDGGLSFEEPVYVPRIPRYGTMAVGPDGEVYTVGIHHNSHEPFYVAKSTNAQDASTTPNFSYKQIGLDGKMIIGKYPNPVGLLGQAEIAVDNSDGTMRGNVYVLCTVKPSNSIDNADVHFRRSSDGGQTWSPVIRVNDDPEDPNSWQWFGTMSVAPNGRIDAIWNDTRNSSDYHISEVFYTYSMDGGTTWTPNCPITPAFNSHLGWPGQPPQKKLGDYYHMISDNAGVNLAYAATFNGEQDVYFVRIGIHDCNENGVPDEDDIIGSTSSDCNTNTVPDECEPGNYEDCNGNDIPDLCDIAGSTSEDCNYSRVPDECEPDCNDNGQPDDCDIADESSLDINDNGFPDECEILGDLNCDGGINEQDINPFVLALVNPAVYQQAYPDCNVVNADCNADGNINSLDIEPFVGLLMSP